jgi:nitroreductase
VEDSILQTILNACVNGANASNRQSYSIIVIRGEDKVQKVFGCGAKAPAALLFCVDFNRIYDVGEQLGYPSDCDDLFDYLTAHTDAVIVAQTAVITAASLGLSYLYTNSIHNLNRKNIEELYDELMLPEEHFFPVTAVLFGYEDKAPEFKKGRLKDIGIVHYNTYQRLTPVQKEEIIRTVNNPENHFGDKGGCNSYLEFYYTKWASPKTAEENQRVDQVLYEKMKSFIK